MDTLISYIKEFLKKLFSIFLSPQPTTSATADNSSYKRKYRVMNQSEQALYINLQKSLGDKFIVLSKVRIEDFVEVDVRNMSWGKQQGLRGKIKSRHVDFLICDLASTKPILAIELDGSSHNNYKRIERDDFVDSVYKGISLPVDHIHVGSNFSEEAGRVRNILLQKT